MERFAFVIHAVDVCADAGQKYPIAKYLPAPLVESAIRYLKPMAMAHLTGIRSQVGTELEGWFIACPLSSKQLLSLPVEEVYSRLEKCCDIALDLGANIIGLGAFTAVAGDGGITLAKRTKIAVTTGNSYTIATAVEGARRGADLMGVPINEANVAIVGAAGSIGRTSALMLAKDAASVTLIGRTAEKLEPVVAEIRALGQSNVSIALDVATGLKNADVVITVTSAADAIILPEMLKRGAVVCDVSRPRDVSVRVAKERDDVLVIEGGVVSVPGDMVVKKTNSTGRIERPGDFHFGFPPKTAYACMSETMLLALEGRYESFTLGKDVSVAQAEETQRLAHKHGFRLAGFRSFEKAVTEEQIARVRKAAGRNK